MKTRVGLALLAGIGLGLGGCQSPAPSGGRTLPSDPVFDAIYEKLGDPDRVTGSGRSYLHYDMKHGQTLTLIVSGGRILGSEIAVR